MLLHDFSARRALTCLFVITTCLCAKILTGIDSPDRELIYQKYGRTYSISYYIIKLTFSVLLTILSLFNLFSLFFKTKRISKPDIPKQKVCFRVVTRGTYPDLVKENMKINLSILSSYEKFNYTYEVVTDTPIDIKNLDRCYEVIVPSEYKTKNGAKYKARALQYAIEANISRLDGDDWIMHLDEESLLTKSCVEGVMSFVNSNKHQIGQGTHTYGKGKVVHTINTLADSQRTALDLTSLRFGLKYLHRPIFLFKGSFVLTKYSAEKYITYDHGLEGSIAEDSFFACRASNLGYSFGWVEGELLENSPFSIMDFLKQRRRWNQGLFLVVKSKNLKADFTNLFLRFSFLVTQMYPIGVVMLALEIMFPVSLFTFDVYINTFNQIAGIYLFYFGLIKSNDLSKMSIFKLLLVILGAPLIIAYLNFAQAAAIVWSLVTSMDRFDIVDKRIEHIV